MGEIFLTREQSRAVDQIAMNRYGIPGIVLMENAGRGVVEVLLEMDPKLAGHSTDKGTATPVTIVCGKGNNAGDGFVIARHLQIHRVPSQVILLASPCLFQGDAQLNYQILCHTDVPIVDLSGTTELLSDLNKVAAGTTWLIDAMLGTGAQGNPREPFRTAISWCNNYPARCLAVDVPSGLDCNSGEPAAESLQADITCTFVAAKSGFAKPTAARFLGDLRVVSIGIPPQIIIAAHSA
ncbi:MAG: NAD(P)H-hydrate epimerase [Planctomycetaceae bacterium]|nr:NAD(P)H-hydrate epimerase [Planctomycetaceae bacterium]HCK42231.1 NAD(P)H-hydrate epimerase [Planctomycetaceae bacterium]